MAVPEPEEEIRMIGLISSHRSVAIVQLREETGELYYHSVKSSKGKVIGQVPLLGRVIDVLGRKPAMRKPFVVVEYEDGAVYASQLTRKFVLGEWIRVAHSA